MHEQDSTNELHTQIQYRLIEKLAESERRYRELVENLREIVFEGDREGRLTFINRAWTETLGYSVKECEGRRLEEFIDRADTKIWQSTLQRQADCCLELRFTHQQGNTLWLELSLRFVRDAKLSGSLVDITGRKQAEIVLKQSNEELETKVRQRTSELTHANRELTHTLQQLQQAQGQLIQQEKMSSLGQLVAGIAHEINNPINFVHGNIVHVREYARDLLELVRQYQQHYPHPVFDIQSRVDEIDLDFIGEDLPKTLSSMQMGSDRIREIVLSLRNFSRLNEAQIKAVDIHEGLNNTLVILNHRLKARPGRGAIQTIIEYADLPLVECYAGLLNQVFMNILANAIDALDEKDNRPIKAEYESDRIILKTSRINEQWVEIAISDNGLGMSPEIRQQIFNPFFTTKPVGKGTGMGMAISYQVVTERHGGKLECFSTPDKGTTFAIQIPIRCADVVDFSS
ncbi:MAG: PAS domain S-box protein [Cyanobacteria bacterium SBLK]|nr:PAS domain S-box protein [Cyanobacteria bacterium SBLK]